MMLGTIQAVTNIICQNVMLLTDKLCWRHEIQPGAKFNEIFSILKDPERDTVNRLPNSVIRPSVQNDLYLVNSGKIEIRLK